MARNSIAPGGYIGGEPPRRPMFNQLSGVWKLDDAMERQKNNAWTNALGVEDVFSTYLYTGNGSTQTITNGIDLSGKGGLVWTKLRNSGLDWHVLQTSNQNWAGLFSNRTEAQNTSLSSFFTPNATGYTVGANYNLNANNQRIVSWTFRKQAKFFDVVTYVGDGASSRSISHDLGSTPGCVIVKATSTTSNWAVWHRNNGSSAATYLNLNSTVSASISASYNSFATSTAIRIGLSEIGPDVGNVNTNGVSYVAYLFAHDAGGFGDSGNESVVKCGSYTGNGTVNNATTEQPGPDINLGWEPQWVMIKNTTSSDGWWIFDTMRGFNANPNGPQLGLYANTPGAESTLGTSFVYLKLTNTGFKITAGTGAYFNESGNNYIYIAIRRGPMKAPTDATKVFHIRTRTGTGAADSITGVGFPPDAVLGMGRNNAPNHAISDKLRGTASQLWTAFTSGQQVEPDYITAFGQDGISVGLDTYHTSINGSGKSLVPAFFRRAPGFFDVVAYTGTGASIAVNHNLGVTPELIIGKCRTSSTFNWIVYHQFLGTGAYIALNTNAARVLASLVSAVSETSFTGEANAMSSSGNTHVAYLFATCPGVSKVGSYTGTGTTLNVDCGFTNGARFVLIKRTDSAGDWYVWDTARGIIAANDPYLLLNGTAAEVTNTDFIDPLNAGFQISSTAPAAINANGGSFIFFAVA